MQKKLYRSQSNKILAGICGGLGEYMNVDATVLRVLWILIVIFTGFFPGVLAYIIGIFIIPEHPTTHANAHAHKEHTQEPQHHPDAE